MNKTNMLALAKVIRLTKRFDMGVITSRYNPETGETLVEVANPTPQEFWTDPTLIGDYTAWANALSEHEPLDDEDAAAAWLGLTIEQYDRLSYTDGYETNPSVWKKASYEISPDMAAKMLERIVEGSVIL